MQALCIAVQKEFCDECALALRRFIGGMEGVTSIDVVDGQISVTFDETKIGSGPLYTLVCNNVEKLGYKLIT